MNYIHEIIIAGGICGGFLLVGVFIGMGICAYSARTKAMADYADQLKASLDKMHS